MISGVSRTYEELEAGAVRSGFGRTVPDAPTMLPPRMTDDRWTGLKPTERPFRDGAWFYSEYRYRPSEAFLRQLAGHLGWSSSDRVLDLGAGPAHVSLRLAPLVGEVVVMDPEDAMIEEGRRRADAAEIDNLSFIVGGSDDLARLSPELGEFAAVTISQAFHWAARVISGTPSAPASELPRS